MEQSIWLQEIPAKNIYHSLTSPSASDVIIIGAGITGLTTAYLLQKAGKKVMVLEKDTVGSGETGYTTAFITQAIDLSLQDMSKTFDEETAKLVWQSGHEAIERISNIVIEEKIECEFRRCSAFLYTQNDKDVEMLQNEGALANKLGFTTTSFRTDEKVGFSNKGYLEIPDQATFEPLAYLHALAAIITKNGGIIYEKTMVEEIKEEVPMIVTANGIDLTAQSVVMATHSPFKGMILQDKLTPYLTYVIAAHVSETKLPEVMMWDTVTPYHYLRVDKKADGFRIILGGEDHVSGKKESSDQHAKLQAYLTSIGVTNFQIMAQWSGQIFESNDGLPYIGKTSSKELYCGTGYSGNGMTYGTITAMSITDLILKKENAYTKIYDPNRITKKIDFIKHGIEELGDFIKDRIPSGENFDDIKPGEGKVIDLHGQKAAVFRNNDGKLSILSATCTHLGCIVQWNPQEKTWDCPCHGSRFGKDGTVIRGPAQKPLPAMSQ